GFGVADRAATGRGQRAAGALSPACRDLPAEARQGTNFDGQQHLQRVALRGCLARSLGADQTQRGSDRESATTREEWEMGWKPPTCKAAALLALLAATPAFAQKPGGILRMPFFDSPASMSLHEEATFAVLRPMMGVFNNLVMYKQDVPQNSMESIVPDLATGWSWNEEGTELTFPLRQGVRWHDDKPFTANDVKCTWDLLTGKAADKLRVNPRKSWYANLDEVTTNGDYEVTFHLRRPQPSFVALLASGWSPVYPCHVPAREMRLHPVGTGPFKFVEFKPNEAIRITKNTEYW